jgi:type 1 fimbria pilin
MTQKFAAALCAAVLTGAAMWAAQGRAADEKTFRGEIADSQCALNVHSLSQSHKEMIAMKPEIKTDADCAHFCVKERGGRFMLQTKGKVYKLDAQVLAEQWAGQKVKLTGTLDPKTNTITVGKIEALSSSPGTSPRPN